MHNVYMSVTHSVMHSSDSSDIGPLYRFNTNRNNSIILAILICYFRYWIDGWVDR